MYVHFEYYVYQHCSIRLTHSWLFFSFAPVDEVYDYNEHMEKHGPALVYKFENYPKEAYWHDGYCMDLLAHIKAVPNISASMRQGHNNQHVILNMPAADWAIIKDHKTVALALNRAALTSGLYNECLYKAKNRHVVRINQNFPAMKSILIRFPEPISNAALGDANSRELKLHFAPVQTTFSNLGADGRMDFAACFFIVTIKSQEFRKVEEEIEMSAEEKMLVMMRGM